MCVAMANNNKHNDGGSAAKKVLAEQQEVPIDGVMGDKRHKSEVP